MMVAAARKFQEGGPRSARRTALAHVDLASFEGVVSKAVDWRTLGLHHHPEETA